MLQGSFGTKPWKKAGERATAGSAAADEGEDGTYSTAVLHGESNHKPRTLNDDKAEEKMENDGNVENDERAKIEEDQMVIDEAFKELIEMELKQKKKEGDWEGYDEGSANWLKFNIWKTEQDWKKTKRA